MIRAILATAIGVAVLSHSLWGCVACQARFPGVCGLFHEMAPDGHEHASHSHTGDRRETPHPKHPTPSDGHCLFLLRLPAGSESPWGLAIAAPSAVPAALLPVIKMPVIVSPESGRDPSDVISAPRRAEGEILLV